jgi:hypothetical protein
MHGRQNLKHPFCRHPVLFVRSCSFFLLSKLNDICSPILTVWEVVGWIERRTAIGYKFFKVVYDFCENTDCCNKSILQHATLPIITFSKCLFLLVSSSNNIFVLPPKHSVLCKILLSNCGKAHIFQG